MRVAFGDRCLVEVQRPAEQREGSGRRIQPGSDRPRNYVACGGSNEAASDSIANWSRPSRLSRRRSARSLQATEDEERRSPYDLLVTSRQQTKLDILKGGSKVTLVGSTVHNLMSQNKQDGVVHGGLRSHLSVR